MISLFFSILFYRHLRKVTIFDQDIARIRDRGQENLSANYVSNRLESEEREAKNNAIIQVQVRNHKHLKRRSIIEGQLEKNQEKDYERKEFQEGSEYH